MPFKKIIHVKIPAALIKPILVDANGLPRYWSVVWSSLFTHNLELSSETLKLRYIESLYMFADKLKRIGYLDDILSDINISEIGELLEAFFIQLRNQNEITGATENKWQICFSFVRAITTLLTKSQIDINKLSAIESKLFHLGQLYGQLRIQKSKRPDNLRSLPVDLVSCLYEMLDPSEVSISNPFKRNLTRWNVFITYICMLHMGLRSGEVLLLPVNAVKSAFDNKQSRKRYWINVTTLEDDYIDTRYNKPSIKTVQSIRQIPISELTANLIQIYEENYRGKPPHPYLINSQWNRPLSHESLTKYYERISNYIPKNIIQILKNRTGKNTISPHDLRHTCAVVRLSQFLENGDTVENAMPKMRVFFGWSRQSTMPSKYARAVFEDRISGIWSDIMDERIAILRNIPKGL